MPWESKRFQLPQRIFEDLGLGPECAGVVTDFGMVHGNKHRVTEFIEYFLAHHAEIDPLDRDWFLEEMSDMIYFSILWFLEEFNEPLYTTFPRLEEVWAVIKGGPGEARIEWNALEPRFGSVKESYLNVRTWQIMKGEPWPEDGG